MAFTKQVRRAMAILLATTLVAQAPAQQLADIEPVTDAEIQRPDPSDWLSWRRTLDNLGFSPLDQIDRANVPNLRMVWAHPLPPGHQEGTPLVHDGILYFPGPSDVIEAIDAKSGVMLWQYRRELPADIGDYLPTYDTNRNLAIYGGLIIAASADDYIYALDARTGKLAWETKILDYRNGAKQSSGPIIAHGLAITGRSCEPEGGPAACVITAHDALTGKEVWRTPIIAQGDDPNDATWGGLPLAQRQQVGAWMIASFDPELGLIYMGTSVSAPAPKILLSGNDFTYLYHNSTLALDVKTGRIVWHYQHLVDHWDLDHPFARMLVDSRQAPDPSEVAWVAPDIDPKETYRILTGVPGKTGIVYTLDRETGKFLWARPTFQQNVVKAIDGATGKVTVNPEALFTELGKPLVVCPSTAGGTNYSTGAYSPLTATMYLTASNTCAEMIAVDPAAGGSLYGLAQRQFIPPEADGMLGVIHAVNAVTGKTEWVRSQRAGMQSLLTTGGGLLFAGDADGWFRALDQRNGNVLWAMNLGSSVTGYPATFAVDGQQYVAVSTGRWLADTFTPELTHGQQNTLFVFALPKAGIGHDGPYREPITARGKLAAASPEENGEARAFARAVADGIYSASQAEQGRAVYRASCAACHGVDFQPAPGSAPVKGAAFLANWQGRSLDELYKYLRETMPPGAGGSLSSDEYLTVMAYLLQENGFRSGEPLSADPAMLQSIGFAR